jgi:hypothetical protein
VAARYVVTATMITVTSRCVARDICIPKNLSKAQFGLIPSGVGVDQCYRS